MATAEVIDRFSLAFEKKKNVTDTFNDDGISCFVDARSDMGHARDEQHPDDSRFHFSDPK